MPKRGQQAGAFGYKAGQSALHLVKGDSQAAQFFGALHAQFRHRFTTPQTFGGSGQFAQRACQAAERHPDRRHDDQRGQRIAEGRYPGPLDWRAMEPCGDVQPLAITQRDGQLHFHRGQIKPHHLFVHPHHFGCHLLHHGSRAGLMQFHPDFMGIRIIQKTTDARLDHAAHIMGQVIDRWRVGQ